MKKILLSFEKPTDRGSRNHYQAELVLGNLSRIVKLAIAPSLIQTNMRSHPISNKFLVIAIIYPNQTKIISIVHQFFMLNDRS